MVLMLSPEPGNLGMVRRAFGDVVVTSFLSPGPRGWAIVFVSAAALALSACGRKGPLDLPPTSNVPTASAAPTDTEAEAAAKPSVFNPSYGTDAAPTAPKGAKKPFILDPLLGN